MASSTWPFVESAVAQIEVGQRIIRPRLKGRAVFANRCRYIALALEGAAQIVMGGGIGGMQLEQRAVFGDGPFEIPFPLQGRP